MPLQLKYDLKFEIATGRSREETSWKNKEMLWSELIERLEKTHYTAETQAEYALAKKPRQLEIKDVGGFVGGYIAGGRRNPTSVKHRQLITLDLDYAKGDFWEDLQLMYGNAALIYSTHSSSPESPRFRLILLLDRPVRPDEYQAIARRIAGWLDIEQFDNTGFQPERLMFWPSTSKDAEYIFKYQDGPPMCADAILKTYHDWRDSSAWPVSVRVDKLLQRNIARQGDPLLKDGNIGAFCRTYNIDEAIATYLSDIYDPCDTPDRYTYKEGSAAAGLIVYDDKFAYSHHGTDPISGKLCNAFDLVRLHKFGLMDEGATGKVLPSFTAMQDLCTKDSKVKVLIGIERIIDAKQAFSEFKELENIETTAGTKTQVEVSNTDWLERLDTDKRGNYTSSINNIYLVLKHDTELRGKLYFNEFEGLLIAKGNLPWRNVTKQTNDFTDDDADCLAHYLEVYKMPFTHLQKALSKIRTEYKTHPVRDYLNKQKWDRIQRLDSLLIDYLGAKDDFYTRTVTRKSFIACVARVFEPGVKFDTVLTMVGKQGTGKSTILAKLGGEWFSDCLGDIHTKEGMESLRGVWLMEIAEMASFKKADQDAIKRFLTSREDIYRPAYGKQQVRFQRQCVFFGTTNKEDFLSDPTGDRRFLPVATSVTKPAKNLFTDLTPAVVNQVWAEALHYYNENESIDLSEEAKELAEVIRESHTVQDPRAGHIQEYLKKPIPDNWDTLNTYERRAYLQGDELQAPGTIPKNVVCVAEVWCEALGCTLKDMTTNSTKFIHEILRNTKGWRPTKGNRKFSLYGYQRAYERVPSAFVSAKNGNSVFVLKTITANTDKHQKN
ncbi:virulence-associated E family protein [Ferruginibacter paludis]|uniref:virulence-associated E family protein n=1 Tax=Ferruginibacter paludis TaxID=1310417 RepID=UPI0025B4FA5E|nr:virulence-associated E family protein [Ferruginibacter paludis]MDN3657953.1 virulence-associated E family protein [Ferruginibacter paludis]